MKLFSKISLILLFISSMACTGPEETRSYELIIAVADSIKSTALPPELARICVPIHVSDTLLLLSNVEGRSPILTLIENPKLWQSLFIETDDLLSNIFKANQNPYRLTKQIENKLSEVIVNPNLRRTKPLPILKVSIDSLLNKSKKEKVDIFMFAKNGTDTLYHGYPVYYNVEALRNKIGSMLASKQVSNPVMILFGLDISALRDTESPAISPIISRSSKPHGMDTPTNTIPKPPIKDSISTTQNGRNSTSYTRKRKIHENAESILDRLTDEDARSGKITKEDLSSSKKTNN